MGSRHPPTSSLESDMASRSSSNGDQDVEAALSISEVKSSTEEFDGFNGHANGHTNDETEVGDAKTPVDLLIENERKQPWPSTLERTLPLLASPASYLGNNYDIDKMTRSPLRSAPQQQWLKKLAKIRAHGKHHRDSSQDLVRSRSLDYKYGAVSNSAIRSKIEAAMVNEEERDTMTGAKAYLKKINGKEQKDVACTTRAPKALLLTGDANSFSPGNLKEQELDHLISEQRSKAAEPVEAKATFLQCVINQTNILVGLGMLGLPFVLRSSGWLGGLSFLMGFAVVTWRTAIMIGRSLNGDSRPCSMFNDWPSPYKTPLIASSKNEIVRLHKPLKTFPDIARAAFGETGNVILSTVLYFELFSCLAICMVTMSEHMNVLFPAVSITGFKFIMAAALAAPTLVLRTPRLISYLSAVGMIANISVISVVVGSALTHGDVTADVAPLHGVDEVPPYHITWRTSGIPLALGMSAYTFSGHATVPSIYTSMKNPQHFESMITVSFIVVLSCCVSMAVSGYYMFGNMVHDQVTISLSWIPGYGDGIIITTLEGLMVISSFSTFTLCMYPIAIGIEEIVDPFVNGNVQRELASHAIRIILLLLAMLVAIIVPSFSFICSLVGLITTMTVAVMFPTAAYVKLFGSHISRSEKLLYYIFFLFGLVSAVVGTYATVAQELKSGK